MTLQSNLTRLTTEMMDWAEGRRSYTNELMGVEVGPEHRQATLVAIAQADAAQVAKLSAAIVALVAIVRSK